MENKDNFNEIAYKKAQKRVKEIMNFYYFVVAYLVVAVLLLYKNYDGNIFNISKDYIVFMLALQGILLFLYGVYLFFPRLHNWEERQIRKYMQKEKEESKK